MKKYVSTLALAGTLAFAGAGTAQAGNLEPYPAPTQQGTVSDGTVAPGETVVFSGSGFIPGETIAIDIDFSSAPSAAGIGTGNGIAAARGGAIILAQAVLNETTEADAEGNFSFPVELEAEGTYRLTATGLESGNVVTAVVEVNASNGSGGGDGGADDNGAVDGGSDDSGTVVGGGTTGGTTTGGGSDVLANTGADSAMLLWGAAGIGALVLGTGSVVMARRRSGAEA